MNNIRQRTDSVPESITKRRYQRPFHNINCVKAAAMGLRAQVSKISLDTSSEGLLHKGDPAPRDFHEFREPFGRDQLLVVAIKSKDMISFEYLDRFKALHLNLQSDVPQIEEITSLINQKNIKWYLNNSCCSGFN